MNRGKTRARSATARVTSAKQPQASADVLQKAPPRPRPVGAVLAAGCLCVLLLFLALRLYEADLRLPLNYLGDAVVFLSKAKGILQGDWIYHNSRIGMPFGADLRDFPLNITLDSSVMLLMGLFTQNAALLVNVYWLLAVVATAMLATYALLRLGASRAVAICIGAIYALSPHTYFRGISHLHSLFYLVPLIATGAIELALGRLAPPEGSRRTAFRSLPAYLWFACPALGLTYQYSAFFGCFVLSCATALAYLARRNWRECLTGVFAVALICSAAIIDLSPSLIYWAKHGTNPAMAFKYPAEAEIYGLKIRTLVTPVPDHPIPFFRRAERYLTSLQFPLENENGSARLGTLGSIGFLLLTAFALYSGIRNGRSMSDAERALGVFAALCMGCVLLATIGGFGSLFNSFVIPDIRCYNRITPFISFFSLAAVAVLLTLAQRRWARGSMAGPVFAAALGLCAIAAAYDQRVISGWTPHEARQQLYQRDDQFVRRVEAIMPQDGMIFQLPYTDFPVERLTEKMFNNDQGRPYLHSQKCRWAWGAVTGTTSAEWNRQAAAQPVPQMIERLTERGFSGLWVDLFGYKPESSPEPQLVAALEIQPLRSADGRYLFFDLQPYAAGARSLNMSPNQAARRPDVQFTFERGLYPAERNTAASLHWSHRRHGRIVFINPLGRERKVRVSLLLRTGDGTEQQIQIFAPNETETVPVAGARSWEQTLALPSRGQVSVDFASDGKRVVLPPDPNPVYFGIDQLTVEDR